MAVLVPCLITLRAEINAMFPGRDKASDGWIGDLAHQAEKSDHNPDDRGRVHAIDVDEDLRAAGHTMAGLVAHVVREHAEGRDDRLTYIIYERTICSASHGWKPRPYTGKNPHDKHAHFSASNLPSRENNTRPFLRGYPMLTDADRQWLDGRMRAIAEDVWNHTEPDPAGGSPRRTGGDMRNIEYRAGNRHKELVDLLHDESQEAHEKLDRILAKLDTPDTDR